MMALERAFEMLGGNMATGLRFNLDRAITESCNTFIIEPLSRAAVFDSYFPTSCIKSVLGVEPLLDIHREENTALMPTRGWKQARLNEGLVCR